jgi:hypothetical protein
MTTVTKTHLRTAAAGDLNNDKIKCCNICRTNGWPHEPVTFTKVPGRTLSDGTNEVKKWTVTNYYDGRQHSHKQPSSHLSGEREAVGGTT